MRKKLPNTKAEWTTGPWIAIDKSVGGAFQIIPSPNDPGDLRIATVTNAPNDLANARLIAAAPELYEALERLLLAHTGGTAARSVQQQREDAAFATASLAKARGESLEMSRKGRG